MNPSTLLRMNELYGWALQADEPVCVSWRWLIENTTEVYMSNNFNLKANLCYALREQSGLEQHRPYLGMSGIAGCPRKLYMEFMGGRKPPTDQQHWYCWTGYMHEAAVVRLAGLTQLRQRALFDVAAPGARQGLRCRPEA